MPTPLLPREWSKTYEAPIGHPGLKPGDFDSIVGATAVLTIGGHQHVTATIIGADITNDGQAVTFTYRMH